MDGVASPTRLHFPDESATAAEVEAFGRGLVALVDRAKPEQSLLLTKPTNRLKHSGGMRIGSGTPEEKALRAWIARLASMSEAEAARAIQERDAMPAAARQAPAESLRRLTHTQYNNTVRDLLEDATWN